MKLIDLLVKISKGEEVPEKIRIGEMVFEKYTESPNIDYCIEKGNTFLFQEYVYAFGEVSLNDEIEIIEEKEIELEDIEEMNLDVDCTSEWNFGEVYDTINQLIRNQKKIINVINDMRDKECINKD